MVSFFKMWAMLVVGLMYLTISAAAPFEKIYYVFSDHWLQVVIFYTLYLMVPLLKQHLCFTWHTVATEGVDLQGTELQPCG